MSSFPLAGGCSLYLRNSVITSIRGLFDMLLLTRALHNALCRQALLASQAERVGQGEVGGCYLLGDSTWQLLGLSVERPWSALGGLFLSSFAQTSLQNTPLSLQGLHFWHCRQFSIWTCAYQLSALTIESSVMSECSQGHKSAQND